VLFSAVSPNELSLTVKNSAERPRGCGAPKAFGAGQVKKLGGVSASTQNGSEQRRDARE
jgi:hypothetical protein